MDYPLNKLNYALARLFKIIKIVGHLYCLKLLISYRVQLIFYTNRLYKDLNNPLLGQVNKELNAIKVNSKLEQEVKKILLFCLIYSKLYYKVEQKG